MLADTTHNRCLFDKLGAKGALLETIRAPSFCPWWYIVHLEMPATNITVETDLHVAPLEIS